MQQIWYLLFFFFRSLFILTSTNVLIIFLFMGNLLVQPGPNRKVRWGGGENKLPTRDAATVDPWPPPPHQLVLAVSGSWRILPKLSIEKCVCIKRYLDQIHRKQQAELGKVHDCPGRRNPLFFFFFPTMFVAGLVLLGWRRCPWPGHPTGLSPRGIFFLSCYKTDLVLFGRLSLSAGGH